MVVVASDMKFTWVGIISFLLGWYWHIRHDKCNFFFTLHSCLHLKYLLGVKEIALNKLWKLKGLDNWIPVQSKKKQVIT